MLFVLLVDAAWKKIMASPFHFPYYTYGFDTTGKRDPCSDDLIDDFLIHGGFSSIQEHYELIINWKQDSQAKIQKMFFKKLRTEQLKTCIDDDKAFQFIMFREQTRYKQSNYMRRSYTVPQIVEKTTCNYAYLYSRNEQLKAIDYACTLRAYHSKNQRKLLTKDLRRSIMERDNYTCQMCGKYMPDEVGLHIDHIIPVALGGKTVPSNLQVLCSKCNGAKSKKV